MFRTVEVLRSPDLLVWACLAADRRVASPPRAGWASEAGGWPDVLINISMGTDARRPPNSYGTSWWTIDTLPRKATTGRFPPSSVSRDIKIATLRDVCGVRRFE